MPALAGTGKSLRELLGEALYARYRISRGLASADGFSRASKTAVSFKASYDATGTWTFGVDLAGASGGGADTGILDTDLKKLINDLADATQDNWRVLLAFAGLPSLPRILAEAKSYAERSGT